MTELTVTFPNKSQSSMTDPGSKCAGLCTNEKNAKWPDIFQYKLENL